MKEEYTFVTLDNDTVTTGDAVFVDIDETADVDFVHVDETSFTNDDSGFIVMDDSDMYNHIDIDTYISDISEADLSIIL